MYKMLTNSEFITKANHIHQYALKNGIKLLRISYLQIDDICDILDSI